MNSKYSSSGLIQVSTTSNSISSISPQYIADSGTKVHGALLASILLAAFLSGVGNGKEIKTQAVTSPSSKNTAIYDVISKKEIAYKHEKATLISQSIKLQKEFGFKTAQWATILQVERKTLYNWIKNPETKIQDKVAKRLTIFSELFEDMDTGHAHYLASFAFGRYRDAKMANVLTKNHLSFDQVVENYERLYSEFDGKYKRNKHKYSMYS